MRSALFLTGALSLLGGSSFAFAQANTSFELKQSCTGVGACPFAEAAVTGDFDRDGKPDLLTEEIAGGGGKLFELRLGKGDGTFQLPVQAGSANPVGAPAGVGLLAADLDGDGALDLVATSSFGEVDVLFGEPGGAFAAPVVLQVNTPVYTNAVLGDFNGDGRTDIAVGDLSGNITLLQNSGSRAFSPARTIAAVPGGYIASLAAGDVDNDGKTDLAYAGSTRNRVGILWGLGGNAFQDATLGAFPSASVSIGDLNQDGAGDVLVSFNCNAISGRGATPCTAITAFYGGRGAQTTSQSNILPRDPSVNSVQNLLAVDVNADGIADLAAEGYTQNSTSQGLVVWLGLANGAFEQTARQFIATANGGGSMVAGDWNRDGMVDFFQTLNGPQALYTNASDHAPCPAAQTGPVVVVCGLVDNTYVPGPSVRIAATVLGKAQTTAIQEYADGQLVYSQPASSMNFTLPESLGEHLLVSKGWDATGANFHSDRHITVYDGIPGPVCAAAPNAANICLPANFSASAQVRVLANGTTSTIPAAAQLYVDGKLVVNDQSGSTALDVEQSLPAGTHELTFKLFDASGHVSTATRTVVLP